MPNMNLEIPEELHKRVKLAALLQDQTLKEFFTQTLEADVAKRAKQ